MIPALQTCQVNIATKDFGFLSKEVTALPIPIQAVRAVVTCGGDTRSHMIVRAAAPPWHVPIDEEVIQKLFPEDFVSCIRSEVPGETTVSCLVADETTMFAAAAATATLMRSWGWDESPTIFVHLASRGISFAVDPRFEAGVWNVRSHKVTRSGERLE